MLQIESGLFNVKEKHDLLNYETKGFGIDFKIRYGFIYEKLELVINGVYQTDEFSDLRYNPVNSYDRRNFKRFQVGAKYLIFDPKKGQEDKPNVYSYWADRRFNLKNLIPAVSAYVGVNIDSKDNPFTSSGVNGISPSVAIFTQSNITNRSVLISNLILDRIGSPQNDFQYIISLTYAFNQSFIGFIEKHGIKSNFYAENKLSLGLAHLFNDNLQIDVGSTLNFKNTPKINYINLGLSYRLNLYQSR